MFFEDDKVRVRQDAPKISARHLFFWKEMDKFIGKEFIVERKVSDTMYVLKGCVRPKTGTHYVFSEKWLEFVNDIEINESDIDNLFK